jgi:hypothetical protein
MKPPKKPRSKDKSKSSGSASREPAAMAASDSCDVDRHLRSAGGDGGRADTRFVASKR